MISLLATLIALSSAPLMKGVVLDKSRTSDATGVGINPSNGQMVTTTTYGSNDIVVQRLDRERSVTSYSIDLKSWASIEKGDSVLLEYHKFLIFYSWSPVKYKKPGGLGWAQ